MYSDTSHEIIYNIVLVLIVFILNWIKRFSFAKYDPEKLQEKLQDVFGKETTLGSND